MIDEDTFLTSGFSGPERLPTEAPTPQRGFDLSSLGDLGAQIMSLGPLADIANVLNAVGGGSDEFLALINRRLAQSALPDVGHDFPVGPMTAAQADPATRGELEYMQTPEARKAQAGSLERRTREKRGHVPEALVYELESNIGSSLTANSRLQMMTSLENLMSVVDAEGMRFQQTDPDDDRGLEQHMADTLAGGMQHILNFYGNPLKQGLVAGVADPLNLLDLIDPLGGPAVPLLASFRAMGKLNQRMAQAALRVIKKRAQRGELLSRVSKADWDEPWHAAHGSWNPTDPGKVRTMGRQPFEEEFFEEFGRRFGGEDALREGRWGDIDPTVLEDAGVKKLIHPDWQDPSSPGFDTTRGNFGAEYLARVVDKIEGPMHRLSEQSEALTSTGGWDEIQQNIPSGFTRRSMMELAQDVVNNPERHRADRFDFHNQIAELETIFEFDDVLIKDHEGRVLNKTTDSQNLIDVIREKRDLRYVDDVPVTDQPIPDLSKTPVDPGVTPYLRRLLEVSDEVPLETRRRRGPYDPETGESLRPLARRPRSEILGTDEAPAYYHGARGMPLEGLVGTYIDPETKALHLKPASNPSTDRGIGEYRAVSMFQEGQQIPGQTYSGKEKALIYAQQGPNRWAGEYNPGGDGVVFEIDAAHVNDNYTALDESNRLDDEISVRPKGEPPFDRDYEVVIPAGSYNLILPENHAWGVWNTVSWMSTDDLWTMYLDLNLKPREIIGDEPFYTPTPNQTKLRAVTAELAHRMDREFGLTQHLGGDIEGASRAGLPPETLDPQLSKDPAFAEVIHRRERTGVKRSVRQVILDKFAAEQPGGPSYYDPKYHMPPDDRRLADIWGMEKPMDQLREWRDNPEAFAKMLTEEGINPLKPRMTLTQPELGRDPVMVLGDRTFLKEYLTPELVTEVIDELIREWRVEKKLSARQADIQDKQQAINTVLEGLAKDNPSTNQQKAYESLRDLPLKELKKKAEPYRLRITQERLIPELLENYVDLRRGREDEFPIDLPAEEARLRAMSRKELLTEYDAEITYYLYDDVSDNPPMDRLTGEYLD